MASGPPASGSEIATSTKPLRIVFMGTPALAAHILERLADACGTAARAGSVNSGFEIAGVVTRPDQPRGRGLRLAPSEVGVVAAQRGLSSAQAGENPYRGISRRVERVESRFAGGRGLWPNPA